MRIAAAILLGLTLVISADPAIAQHTLEVVIDNGSPGNRIDLLLMGDGYDSTEQLKLVTDTNNAILELFSNPPFETYQTHFNVARISTVSPESGADHPDESEYVDSFFDCAFDCMGLDRLICCDDSTVFSVASSMYPGFDVILLMVNDSEYGGSGGAIAIASNNIQSTSIPPHEFGHTFADLGDEYEDPYPAYVCTDIFPNISFTSNRDALKWNYWVLEETPLPTPDSAAITDMDPVGAYDGACYQEEDLYRPVPNCLMRSLNSVLCPVCAEAMVLSFYGYVEPIDQYSPEEATISGEAGEVLSLWVVPVEPDPDTMEFIWTIDGETANSANSSELELPIECVSPGAHNVTIRVTDLTEMVRQDPEELLAQLVSWTITRTDDGPVAEDCFETDIDSDSDSDSDTNEPIHLNPSGNADSGCGCETVSPRTGFSLMEVLWMNFL